MGLYVGLMSGTSADAIDAALVRTEPSFCVIAAKSFPLGDALQRELRAIDAATPLAAIATLDSRLGRQFADAALALLDQAAVSPTLVRAIGSHGQTVWHAPYADPPYTVQIGDPNVIAERTGITTVADFRRRDVAAGGQGAPLVPAFHHALLQRSDEARCVLNLGGIANITCLPRNAAAEVVGFDTGPASTLMDAWISRQRDLPFDRDGTWAASGKVLPELLERLLADPYFHRPAPKSTGREYFSLAWLDEKLTGKEQASDVQATLALLTARSVGAAVRDTAPHTARLLVCGGGVHNKHLMQLLQAELPAAQVDSTADHAVDPDYVEAAAFAWLAWQRLRQQPGNLRSVTGARHPAVLGGIYHR